MEKQHRTGKRDRVTGETRISLTINLDGSGIFEGSCGIPFMDHMFALFSKHGQFDLALDAEGDVDVDYHHLVEDMGIALGESLKIALGDKVGINRYGSMILPMDETLVTCAIDLSNRAYLVYKVEYAVRFVKDFNTMLLREFFQGFVNSVGANLHFVLHHGDEPHHIAEAQFKSLARALRDAVAIDPRRSDQLLSTKGML
jgi:imidazoleglycerol-phosphate dehydratase